MSLGDYNNNRYQNNGPTAPTVYSAYRMNNAESEVDKTCMTFQYWNNFLRISISPKKETGNDQVQFDMKNGITINLSHTKARIFADVLKKFKEDPEKYNNAGVPSGPAIITISNGKEYNSEWPCVVIRKVDENGSVQATYVYQMKGNYFFSVLNYDESKGSFDRDLESYNGLELDQMITLLENYYNAMTGANAYSVVHELRYEHYHRQNDLKAIADKLGVELRSASSSRNNYSSKSYFNSSNGNSNSSASTNYEPASIDDIY